MLWVLASACGPQVQLEDDGSSTGAASSTGAVETTGGPTTVNPTTVGPVTVTTDPAGPTTTGVDPDDSGSSTGVVIPEDCSTFEQDCPRGYKCMPWASDGGGSWHDTKCVPIVDDPRAPGESCTVVDSSTSGEDDCDGTSMCWDVDPKTNMGTCQLFCTGTEDEPTCADPCDSCSIASDGVLALCFDTCDPIVQDCAPGQGCYPGWNAFECIPIASREGTGIGSECEYINVCPAGLACLDAATVPGCEGMGCCAPYCPVGGADPCPGLLPGTSCMPYFEEGGGPPMECVSVTAGVCVQG